MTRPRPEPLDISAIPGAPAPGSRIACFAELEDNCSKAFVVGSGSERYEFFIHRVGDRVVAYENACPHLYIPLDWQPGKFLSASGDRFICSTHGAQFEIETGFCTLGPCKGAWLRPVAVRVERDEIFLA